MNTLPLQSHTARRQSQSSVAFPAHTPGPPRLPASGNIRPGNNFNSRKDWAAPKHHQVFIIRKKIMQTSDCPVTETLVWYIVVSTITVLFYTVKMSFAKKSIALH